MSKPLAIRKLAPKFPVLISYPYLRKASTAEIEKLVSDPDIEVILDSGAFTAMYGSEDVTLEGYMQFLQQWGDRFSRYFALDVIAQPRSSWSNLQQMLDAGFHPTPVHVWGETEQRMNQMFEISDMVAVVLRKNIKSSSKAIHICLDQKTQWAAGRNIHWFGFTHKGMIDHYKPYSCDCSSWMEGSRWGALRLYMGRGKWFYMTHKQLRKIVVPGKVLNLAAKLGFSREEFFDERHWVANKSSGIPWERFIIQQLSTYSWTLFSREVRMRYGTRVFLAISAYSSEHWRLLRKWITATRTGQLDYDLLPTRIPLEGGD